MPEVQIDAGTLTASAQDRTITGLLLPYGEECTSNLGKFTVSPGVIELPHPDVVSINTEHAREDAFGRATSLRDTPEGVVATFSIAPGPEGDAALRDVQTGKRKHLSAEVKNVAIRAGQAVGGKLFAAAHVARPAFPSATLLAAAPDVGEVEPVESTDPEAVVETETKTNADGSQTVTTTATKVETAEDGTITETKTVTTATIAPPEPVVDPNASPDTEEKPVPVPNTLQAHKGKSNQPRPFGKRELFTLLAASDNGGLSPADAQRVHELGKATAMFALNDVKYDNATGDAAAGKLGVPQWIGEVWDGNDYIQKYLPLFGHADLTALKYLGYKWDVKPSGGDWAGNKSDVPSNAPKFKAVEGTAGRYAMAHDIARELQDFRVFGDASFFDLYYEAGVEDYKRWGDGKVLAAMVANAQKIMADDPTGIDVGPAMSALVDGAAQVIANNATPTYAVVALDYWKQIAKTPADHVLGYLNAQLGLNSEDGRLDQFSLIPSSDLTPGHIQVGSTNAMTVRELPGVPIRANALDVARGGIDEGLFGYLGVQVNKPDAMVDVAPFVADPATAA